MKFLSDEFWPRLVSANKKPGWLKINFDRWKNEDETEEEEEGSELEKIKVGWDINSLPCIQTPEEFLCSR